MTSTRRGRRRSAAEAEPLEARYRSPALDRYRESSEHDDLAERVVFRGYRPGDEVSALDCFNETFNLERTLDYWHWKFAALDGSRHIAVAADEDGTVHAFWGAVPARWQYDGETKRNGVIADVYCRRHPALIRAGTFVKLFHAFIEMFVETGDLSLIQGFAGPVATRIYDLSGILFAKKRLTIYECPVRPTGRRPLLPGRLKERRSHEAVALLDRLWANVAFRYPRSQIRDTLWATRRFVERPDVHYSLHAAIDRRGEPAAWWVTQRSDEKLVLCDVLWNGDAAAFDFMLRALQREASAGGAKTCTTLLLNEPEAEARLVQAGWTSVRHPEKAFWLIVTRDPAYPPDIMERVYLTYADTDFV